MTMLPEAVSITACLFVMASAVSVVLKRAGDAGRRIGACNGSTNVNRNDTGDHAVN